MQSGQVNASQLLAAFLGNVKEKLGQAIIKNDFSGELAKHFPQQSTGSAIPVMDGAETLQADDSSSGSNALAGKSTVVSESKAAVSASRLNNAAEGKNGVNSTAEEEKQLVVSNPAVLQSVLAKLHYPAEIRDQCEKLLSKHGNLSIRELKSLLAAGAVDGSGPGAEVPAQTVRALVASVGVAPGKLRGNASTIGKNVKSSVAIKSKGVYSLRELGKVLDKVVQASQKESLKTQPLVTSASTTSVVGKKTEAGLKKGQTKELVSSILPSFVSRIGKVSSAMSLSPDAGAKSLQSQASAGDETQLGRDQVTAALGSGSESAGEAGGLGASVGDAAATSADVKASGGGGAKKVLTAAEVVSAAALGDKTDASPVGFDVAAKLADPSKAGMTQTKAGSGFSGASGVDNSLAGVESRAQLGGQDTPMLGKHIAKSTGLEERSLENVVSRSTGDNAADNGINLPQMDNSSGGDFVFYDRNQSAQMAQNTGGSGAGNASTTGMASILASYIPSGEEASEIGGAAADGQQQAAGSDETAKAAALAGSQTGASSEDSVLGSVFPAAGNDLFSAMEQLVLGARLDAAMAKEWKSGGEISNKDASVKETSVQAGTDKSAKVFADSVKVLKTDGLTGSAPAAKATIAPEGGKGADNSAQGLVKDASNTATSVPAGTDQTTAVAGGGLQAAGPAANANSQVSASIAQQVALTGLDDPTDQSAQAGDSQTGSSSGSYAAAGVSAQTSPKDILTAMEQVAMAGRPNSADAKRMDETAGTISSPSNAVLLQTVASPPHAINMPLADNCAQSGSGFGSYDPYRAIDLANSAKEQMRSGAGGQLVLEMEPEGLGKINLKVKARKDEISVEAMTQNEPAKQALMNHAVELRQALKTQGLDLGKFMVDVNGGNPGGKNGAQTYHSGGNAAGSSRVAKAPADTTLEASVPVPAVTGGARISVFA